MRRTGASLARVGGDHTRIARVALAVAIAFAVSLGNPGGLHAVPVRAEPNADGLRATAGVLVHSIGAGGVDDWTTYGASVERSGSNPNETQLSVGDASQLQVAWSDEFNHTILGSLIVANGTVYVGDRSGYLAAVNASTGAVLTPSSAQPWAEPFLGNTSYSQCGGTGGPASKLDGLLATPTLLGNRLYEAGGNTSFYTLSLGGKVLQRVDIGNHTTSPYWFDYNWASPLVYHGSAYLGIAALCEFNDGDPNSADWKYVQGQLVKVNLTSGSIDGLFNVTKGTSDADWGGSIWSTAAVDPSTNLVWVTTGNENSSTETPANGEYPRSMVAINATTMKFVGACQVGSVGVDADYGAGPTLFSDSHGNRDVGAINKDGTFYAYNASVATGGNCGNPGTGNLRLAWSDSFCSDSTPGTIAPAAFDGRFLYIASDSCGTGGVVDQVDPNNGTVRWTHTLSSPVAEAHAGVAVADGLVVVAANNVSSGNVGPGELVVLDSSNGNLLYQHNFSAEANAWPVVADGTIFVTQGNATTTDPGWVTAFRVPFATNLTVGDAACTGHPIDRCTTYRSLVSLDWVADGGSLPYSCLWSFGDGATTNGCAVDHAYAAVGVYPVAGTLTDGSGTQLRTFLNITVTTLPSPSGNIGPPSRGGEVFVYDPTENVTLLFGGLCAAAPCTGQSLNDTWTFHAGVWTNLTPQLENAPPPLYDPAAAFDPEIGGVVVFGGETGYGTIAVSLPPTTWEYAHGVWSNVSGTLLGAPPGLLGGSAAYDPDTGQIVLFGGFAANSDTASDATWTLANGTWANDTTAGLPPVRSKAGLAFDGRDHELILFGGRGGSGRDLNDTWAFQSGVWTLVNSSTVPGGGTSVALASEGPNNSVVLWNPKYPNVTWQYSAGEWTSDSLSVHPPSSSDGVVATLASYASAVLVWDGNSTWAFRSLSWAPTPPLTAVSFGPVGQAPATVTFVAHPLGGLPPLAYQWSVDGVPAPGSAASFTHTFVSVGNYSVALGVSDALGDVGSTSVNVSLPPDLVASFAEFPAAADATVAVPFVGASIGGTGGTTYLWEFGDGSSPVSGATVNHTFATAGSYRVNLTADDLAGDLSTSSQTISVAPTLTLGGLGAPPPADAGRPVEILPTLSGGTAPFSLFVQFGDGAATHADWNSSTASPAQFPHIYVAAGSFVTTVSVADAVGANVSAAATWVVASALGLPEIVGPSSASPGSPVTFVAHSTGGSFPVGYRWNFGDGETGSGSSIDHRFASPGSYRVTLSATDATGAVENTSQSVVVRAPLSGPGVPPVVWYAVVGVGAGAVAALVCFVVLRRRSAL